MDKSLMILPALYYFLVLMKPLDGIGNFGIIIIE